MKTKLLELLFSFSKGNLEELMDFARLRSLNLREWHLEVLDYFCNLRIKRNIREGKYQKEYIINKVFPNSAEIKKDWYDINSKLVEVVNRFILYRSIDLKTPYPAMEIAWYYFDNDLKKCFKAQRDNIGKHFQISKDRKFNFYFEEYKFLYLELVNNKSVKGNFNVRLAVDALDKGYIENRLWLMCEELTRKEEWHGVAGESVRHSTLTSDVIWSIIKDLNFNDLVINYLQTLYSIFLKDEIDEKALLILYEQRTILFEKCEKWRARTLLDYLRNLFKYQLNAGNVDYAAYYIEILDLYEKNNVLIERKGLPLGIFKNAVTSGLIAGRIEWSEKFIENYGKYIPEMFVRYSMAQVWLEKDKADKALALLKNFSSNKTIFVVGYRRLLLKIYYQRNDFNAIYMMLPSFKDYIKSRNDLHQQSQNKALAFIKYLNNLIDDKNNFDMQKAVSELAVSDIIWFEKMIKK